MRDRKEEKGELGTTGDNVKTSENYGTHFGVSSAKGSYTFYEAMKTELASKHVRKLHQKTRKVISSSVCLSLFSWCFFSLCLAKGIDSFFTLCFLF